MNALESLWHRLSAALSPQPGQPNYGGQPGTVPVQGGAGQPAKEKTMAPDSNKHRPWTIMIYMAGDNGKVFDTKQGRIKLMAEMTSAGYRDLMEMGSVGTTDNVAVVCLFDTTNGSYRLEVRKGNGFSDSVVRKVPDVNTGSPESLHQFVSESIKAYPADHYALVIWNHGTGWLDVDAYAVVRDLPDGSTGRNPIFRTTPRKLVGDETTRPIAYDDSSKDFLDTHDLRQALTDAYADTGARLDLIGMDACLMSMIEGARELATFTDYFVGSQEVEPMAGWPYQPILEAVDGRPGMAAGDLASTIVEAFAQSYGGTTRAEQTVTQAAVSLRPTSMTAELCKALVDTILADGSPGLRRAVGRARDKALVFQDHNYRDLGDFAAMLASETEWENLPDVNKAAVALRDHLQARGGDAPVLKVGFLPAYQRATGMSVYLPSTLPAAQRKQTLDIYRQLAFPQATGWDKILEWLYGDF